MHRTKLIVWHVLRSRRSGQMLNVAGEKMSEEMFFRALGEAAKQWPSVLKDYTVASSQLGPKSQQEVSHRYLLFIELEGEPLTEQHTALVSCLFCCSGLKEIRNALHHKLSSRLGLGPEVDFLNVIEQ